MKGKVWIVDDDASIRWVLEKAIVFIEELHLAEVTHSDIEIIRLPYVAADDELDEDFEMGEEGEGER